MNKKSDDTKPMTDDEATELHWLVLECLEAMLFEEMGIDHL